MPSPPLATTDPSSSEPSRGFSFELRAPRWGVLVFVITFAFYLLWVPRFLRYSSPPTGDQPFYLMDAASLAQDRDLNVKNNYDQKDFDKFYALAPRLSGHVGTAAPYPLPRQLAPNTIRPPEEQYSHHLPGLPILLFPAWKIGGWFELWWPATIVAMCGLSALLAVNVFLFALQISSSRWAAAAVWLAISFATPVFIYSYLIFTELCVGLLLIYAVRRLSLGWMANGWDTLLLVGLAVGYIPWVAWRCLPLAATLTAYASWQWWSATRAGGGPSEGAGGGRHLPRSSILLILVPVLVSGALILAYHYFLYGGPFPEMRVPELGNVSPFHFPWQGLAELTKFSTNTFALIFDMTFGLLPWAPVYLLSFAGAVSMLRFGDPSVRRLVPALSLVVAPYLFLLAAFEFWHGIWCPPARYLTSLVPLSAAPLGALLAGGVRKWRRVVCLLLFVALAAPGWALSAVLLHDARRIWPSAPGSALGWLSDQAAPFATIDLRRWIPAFLTPDETRLPYLLGGWLAACFVIVASASWLSSPRSVPRIRALVSWACALALVGGASLWVAYPYLKHKTELFEEGRWLVGAAHEDPRGIAYLGGRVYVACYGRRLPSGATEPGRVLVVDLETGATETMPLVADGIALAWDFPGDVKVGPDGLLYVLNNGPGDRALLAVRPDGEVVRRLPTPTSTNVAKGLAIQDDGVFWITDMVGGALRRYSYPSDRSAEPAADTIVDGLNNPGPVAIDGRGGLYVTEGHKWIWQVDPDGTLLRKLEKCSVRSFAALVPPSPWIEASCENSLFSIDTTKPALQQTRVRSGAPLQAIITAISYGSDGLLYTLQGNTLVAYRVEH